MQQNYYNLLRKNLVNFRKCNYSSHIRHSDGNFVDFLRVRVNGGKGGNGAAGFDRNLRVSRGRANGGDGGRGGRVIFVPSDKVDSLNHIPRRIQAEHGGNGGRNMRNGVNGIDSFIQIPIGSEIREVTEQIITPELINENGLSDNPHEDDQVSSDGAISSKNTNTYTRMMTEEELDEEHNSWLASTDDNQLEAGDFGKEKGSKIQKHQSDLISQSPLIDQSFEGVDQESMIVARGGRGGRGNFRFGNNNHECEMGQKGEFRILEINLRTIADIGLVGLPNAGKSSFLTAVSNAHPKIAPYPFTTLNPYVGVIEYVNGDRVTVADIPGLIEGAYQNRGLGHQFLKHIVKARLLALVVDFAQPDPLKDIQVLFRELDLYQEKLSSKCRLIIANKADLLDLSTLMDRIEGVKLVVDKEIQVLPISALHGLAVKKVTEAMRRIIKNFPNHETKKIQNGL